MKTPRKRSRKKRLVVDPVPHLRLAHWVAGKFLQKYPSLRKHPEDLRSEAVLGLVKAASKFDPKRGVQFSTYATTAIWNQCQWWALRGSKHVDVQSEHMAKNCVAAPLVGTIEFGHDIADPGGSIRDYLSVHDGGQEEVDRRELVETAIRGAKFNDREMQFVKLYHFDGLSLKQVADRMGVSKQRAAQMSQETTSKMRQAVGVKCHVEDQKRIYRAAQKVIRRCGRLPWKDAKVQLAAVGLQIKEWKYHAICKAIARSGAWRDHQAQEATHGHSGE